MMNRLVPAVRNTSAVLRNGVTTRSTVVAMTQHHQHHLIRQFGSNTPLHAGSLQPSPKSVEDMERMKRRQEKSQRRQNMVLSLLGGAALVATLTMLLRSDLNRDRTEVADQVEKVTQIRTRMELQREEEMMERRKYEEMLERRRRAHDLPHQESTKAEAALQTIKRRWNSLFMTLGDSLADAAKERKERERKRLVERVYSQLEADNIPRERVVSIRALTEQ